MEQRKITIRKSVAESIAAIALFIESKVMPITAIDFSNSVYDFIATMANTKKSYRLCTEPSRKILVSNA